jgi:uncharacterized alkaline shock family protein YloU
VGKKFVKLDDILISHSVLAELAGLAALECYGVVGMSHPHLSAGVAQILSRDKLTKGVKIQESNSQKIKVELYVIVEYGVNLVEVARNLIDRVKYEIKKYTDVEVESVDIFIQGIKRGK